MNPDPALFEFFFSVIFIFFICVTAALGWTLVYQFHIENVDLRRRLGKEIPADVSLRERVSRIKNRILCTIAKVHLYVRQHRTVRRVLVFQRRAYRLLVQSVNISLW